MIEKNLPRSTTSNRLIVETVVKQINEDCKEIRDNLKLLSIISNPNAFVRIKEEGIRLMEVKGRKYSYYEIGFRFIVDHIVTSLKDKINLNENEEELVKAVMGRVYYNPPVREDAMRAEAADKLDENRGRSAQILEAWLKERAKLYLMYLSVVRSHGMSESPFTSTARGCDMFDNPFASLSLGPTLHKDNGPPVYYNGQDVLEIHNFGDMAASIRPPVPHRERPHAFYK